jgi:hypothetical protein
MKAKKAMKRLGRIETLLGTVIDEYDAATSEISDLLGAAKSSVASAAQALAASPATKPPAKAEPRLSYPAGKRLPAAAKKRGASARKPAQDT